MAYKVVTIENDENETQLNPQEERDFDVLFATRDANNANIDILATEQETNTPVTFKLYLTTWDQDTKQHVPDKDARANAEALTKDLFGLTIDQLLDNQGIGKTFTAYTDGEQGRFNKFTTYTRFDTITHRDAKALRKMTGPFTPIPVGDNTRYHRFDIGFETEIEGENKKFRLAQIAIESDDADEPDTNLSVKYKSKNLDNMLNQIGPDSDLPDAVKEKVRENVERLITVEREKAVERLHNQLGVNIDEMIQNNQGFMVKDIEVMTIPSGDVYFLKGTLEKDTDK